MTSSDIVVTSINPYQRLEHQIKCVDRWRELGYKIVVAQNPDEANLLVEQGFNQENIFRVDRGSTALAMHGKAIPRIRPVLEEVVSKYDPDHLILVNADIYPGVRSKLSGLHSIHPCGAMTRMDVLSLAPIAINRATSYRGGLDCFFFNKQTLHQILDVLSNHPASSRMTFGIPGWDFYLAGAMLRFMPGSALLDGLDLFHVTHPPSYSSMSEFTYYLPDMMHWGSVSSGDPYAATDQFLNSIIERCNRSSANARIVSTIHRDIGFHLTQNRNSHDTISTPNDASNIIRDYAVSETYNAKSALDFYCQSKSPHVRFAEALECLLIIRAARASIHNRKFKYQYPDSSLHKEAILNALRLGAPHLVRYRIIELFVSDITEHNICNRRLLSYLALACSNDRERDLVVELLESLKLEADAKAA